MNIISVCGGIPNHDTYLRTDESQGRCGQVHICNEIPLGLAAVLRQAKAKNSRVLLIDTDSQAHATLVTTGRNDYGVQDSLYTVLMADRQSASQTLANCIVPSTKVGGENYINFNWFLNKSGLN